MDFSDYRASITPLGVTVTRRWAAPIIGAMAVLTTRVDANSEETRKNSAQMTALVEELRARMGAIQERRAAGDEPSTARHRERGKLPVRTPMLVGNIFVVMFGVASPGAWAYFRYRPARPGLNRPGNQTE